MRKTFITVIALAMACALILPGCTTAGDDPTTAPTTAPDTTAPDTTAPDTTVPDTTGGEGDLPASGGLEGSAADVLAAVIEAAGIDTGATQDEPATPDNCQDYLGLTAEQLTQYITDSQVSTLSTTAHLVAVLQCASSDDAEVVTGLVTTGFDTGRWEDLTPECGVAVQAGSYVLLVVSNLEAAQSLLNGFSGLAGDTLGQPNMFYPTAQ